MKDLIRQEFTRLGGNDELFERLWKYGDRPIISWYLRQTCFCEVDLQNVCMLPQVDLTYTQIRYLYYSFKRTSLLLLMGRQEYGFLRLTLDSQYPFSELWISLLCYAYKSAICVAIEILSLSIADANEVANRLNVSKSLVYKVRKPFLKEYINGLKQETP